jgi:hypothetical protein
MFSGASGGQTPYKGSAGLALIYTEGYSRKNVGGDWKAL